jgi:hypothetical protein
VSPRTFARYVWAPDVLTRRTGTTLLVTRVADPALHELSGGACAVWGELSVSQTLSALIDRIAGTHGVEPREVNDQVRECVDALLALGVVRTEDDHLDG